MQVLVLGAGVIGVTTAYELARDGHDVTVIERASGPGLETSFANGGQISVSHTDPWASADNLRRAIKWLWRGDAPLSLNPGLDLTALRWCWQFLTNCTTYRVAINTERMLRVALYSRARYNVLRDELPLNYGLRENGILHVFRDPDALARSSQQAALVRSLGCERRPVTVEECIALEPALAPVRNQLSGGVYCYDDESGDAYRFTVQIEQVCHERGVQFHYDESITALTAEHERITSVRTSRADYQADAIIMALGSYGAPLLKKLGIALPVYPAKGYSITIPADPLAAAPTLSLIDDECKLVYSRLDDQLRVAGMAELAGYDLKIDARRAALVSEQAYGLFPQLYCAAETNVWTGLRPQTPDSVPVLGPARFENLLLNTGHGTLGWTMAAGSARLIADLVGGLQPAIALDGLTLERFN